MKPRKPFSDLPWHKMGFLRVATATPEHRVADVEFNTAKILEALKKAAQQDAQLVLFPELSLTGYSCGDLFYQLALREAALEKVQTLARATLQSPMVVVVGLPVEVHGRLYNCAAFLAGGMILGLVPKTYLPTTHEFYEERWFTSGRLLDVNQVLMGDVLVPIGTDLLFQASEMPECLVGIEICEDLWAVEPPSGPQAIAGATVLLNLSASNETLGKSEYRKSLVAQQSARCLASYVYVSAGPGESTAETVYSGHGLIAENGVLLAESPRFSFATQVTVTDLDLQRLQSDRLRNSSFSSDGGRSGRNWRTLPFSLPLIRPKELKRAVSSSPFVPGDLDRRTEYCGEIFDIQTAGLEKRIRYTGATKIILGLSGGLDSTLALLVVVKVFKRLGRPLDQIVAVTMPGFGTTARTRGNAENLTRALGVQLRVIPIEKAVRQHFSDIKHDENLHDIVYENAQARERTQILMDLANQEKGLVIGTGDLSESALGWCTFNGDQMSMYHVNIGIPKTLVRYLIDWAADHLFSGEITKILRDISATPISAELLPLSKEGKLQQKTEETVGPYDLHDFYLYYFVRHQCAPQKILFLASHAFTGRYSEALLKKWLRVFLDRFIRQQFKRTSMPDGPKVGSVALSPRSDWRMPSDADYRPGEFKF